jgi:hypothetical protein
MNGRRSHSRFTIAASAEAVLHVLRDVILERVYPTEIIALSRDAGVLGEQLKLDVAGNGTHYTEDVRIVESRPVVVDGNVRHRLRLAAQSQAAQTAQGQSPAQLAQEGPVGRAGQERPVGTIPGALGVLTREIRVRFVNSSASGCLIESHVRLDAGTVVALRLFIEGREFVDDVQVVRCQAVEGAGSMFHLGAKYLWVAPPDSGSLRLATQHLAGASGDEIEIVR